LWATDKEVSAFRFVVVNDLHYLCQECGGFFAKLVEQINASKGELDFCILAGDLSDNGTPEQLGPLGEIVGKLRCKVVAVPGNHDHLKDNRKPYEQAFPNATNQHFDHKGWQFIGLDTCDGQKYDKVAASQTTLDYVDALLSTLDRSRPAVVFTHFSAQWPNEVLPDQRRRVARAIQGTPLGGYLWRGACPGSPRASSATRF
jgi:3',5'-cyclic AMP phosphodiesterase CpdA